MGKISSNPTEQTNLGLLSIREFSPYKILLEGYYYIQHKFTDRRAKALDNIETFIDVALERHAKNVANFGQWEVLDNGAG